MAKAIAKCTCKVCGIVFEVTAFRQNRRMADSFEQWAEKNITLCKECENRQIEERNAQENARAIEAAAERGWPELTGSDKQIGWASSIREAGLPGLIKFVEQSKKNTMIPAERLNAGEIALKVIMGKTEASWWIDNRRNLEFAFSRLVTEILHNPAAYAVDAETEAELMDDEATVAEPEQRTHDGIVEITVSEKRVSAAYRKDDDFRALVKKLGYRWDGDAVAWRMEIGACTGSAEERAAELGNKLLNAGFAIRIQDAETRRNAIEGNYQPMTHRWIACCGDDFSISWGRDEDFYDRARRLPGAKYDRGVKIPAREFETVLDFAHTYDFRLSPGAQELIDEMRVSIVSPAAAKEATYTEHPVTGILDSSRDIIDDLKD